MPSRIQFQNAMSPVTPHLSTMLGNFFRPGSFLTLMSSLPVRYSMGDNSASSPETSEKEPLTAVPSSLMPLMMTSKLYPPYGSARNTGGIVFLFLYGFG